MNVVFTAYSRLALNYIYIDIYDSPTVEEEETFTVTLTPTPLSPLFSNNDVVIVTITDTDSM